MIPYSLILKKRSVLKEVSTINILIAGGTGFIGKHLTQRLLTDGHHVYILTRTPEHYQNEKQITYLDYFGHSFPKIHTVINLAGDSLFGYWTKNKKARILSSRIDTTRMVLNILQQIPNQPELFINASAVGFYGTSKEKTFTENTNAHGDDFLAHVVSKWEATATQASELGIRTVLLRLGIVLGKEGSLPLMSLPVKLGFGGKIGSGEQWISWIHIDDVISLILFCLNNQLLSGPINATSPNPVQNKAFMKTIAHVLRRPYWLPVPAPIIRLAMGEMSELITKGQYVLPEKAQVHGFTFSYPELEVALKSGII